MIVPHERETSSWRLAYGQPGAADIVARSNCCKFVCMKRDGRQSASGKRT